jgi:hypothetical protein
MKLDKKNTKRLSTYFSDTLYWKYSKEMIGSLYYTKNMIDGIIFISTYPCGIDHVYSVTLLDNGNESIRKRIENDDVVNIDIIDENDFALKASNTYTPLADIRKQSPPMHPRQLTVKSVDFFASLSLSGL